MDPLTFRAYEDELPSAADRPEPLRHIRELDDDGVYFVCTRVWSECAMREGSFFGTVRKTARAACRARKRGGGRRRNRLWADAPDPRRRDAGLGTLCKAAGTTVDAVRADIVRNEGLWGEGDRFADPEALAHIVPPQEWRALALLVREQSKTVSDLMELVIAAEARRTVKPSARRPDGGTVSWGTARGYHHAASFLLTSIFDACARYRDDDEAIPEILVGWAAAAPPKLKRRAFKNNPRNVTNVRAPSLATMRAAHDALNAEVWAALGVTCLEDELAAIERMTLNQLKAGRRRANRDQKAGVWRSLRRRLMFGVLAVCAVRTGAAARLTWGDFWTASRVGMARISWNPRKHTAQEQREERALHEGVELMARSLRAVVELTHGKVQDEWYVLAGTLSKPWEKPASSSLTKLFVGGDGRRPVVPMDDDASSTLPGYEAREVRRFCFSQIDSLRGFRLLPMYGIWKNTDWCGHIFLMHNLGGLRGTYGDASNGDDNTRIAFACSKVIYRLLTTIDGADVVIDVERLAAALAARDRALRDIDDATAQDALVQREVTLILARPRDEDREERMLDLLERMAERQSAAAQIQAAAIKLSEQTALIERLLRDREQYVEWRDGGEPPVQDPDRVLAELEGQLDRPEEAIFLFADRPISTSELAYVADLDRSVITRAKDRQANPPRHHHGRPSFLRRGVKPYDEPRPGLLRWWPDDLNPEWLADPGVRQRLADTFAYPFPRELLRGGRSEIAMWWNEPRTAPALDGAEALA